MPGAARMTFAALFLFVRQGGTKKILEVEMGILLFVWTIFRKLWHSSEAVSDGIDCHKWESKVEIFRNLSSGRH